MLFLCNYLLTCTVYMKCLGCDFSHLYQRKHKNLLCFVHLFRKMNFLFLPHQTVSDIEQGWILVNKDQHRQLKSLQEKGSKKEVSKCLT